MPDSGDLEAALLQASDEEPTAVAADAEPAGDGSTEGAADESAESREIFRTSALTYAALVLTTVVAIAGGVYFSVIFYD